MPKVTEAHIAARRGQIVDAAWECFARKGYHQSTMQDICQESGLSPGAIYRYFESKESILKAINDRSQEMSRAVVEEAHSQTGGGLDALEAIGQTMLGVFNDPMFETTSRVNIETWPEIVRSDELRAGMREEVTFWRSVVSGLLGEAKEQGQLREEVDPQSMAVLLIAAWEGVRHWRLIDPDNFSPERIIDLMRTLASEGTRFGDPLEGQRVTRVSPLGMTFGMERRPRRESAEGEEGEGA
jgi:AcrR family transcriptional regulator